MWSTQRNLSGLINNVLVNRKYDLFPVLEEELNKNVDHFCEYTQELGIYKRFLLSCVLNS